MTKPLAQTLEDLKMSQADFNTVVENLLNSVSKTTTKFSKSTN